MRYAARFDMLRDSPFQVHRPLIRHANFVFTTATHVNASCFKVGKCHAKLCAYARNGPSLSGDEVEIQDTGTESEKGDAPTEYNRIYEEFKLLEVFAKRSGIGRSCAEICETSMAFHRSTLYAALQPD